MGLTVTLDTPRSVRISRDLYAIVGRIAFDASYPTGGELLTDISKYFKASRMFTVQCESTAGYMFEFDKTNNKLKAFAVSALTGVAAEAAHTHAVALDGGASGAEAAHTHGGGPIGALVEASLAVTKGTPKLTHAADPSDSATDGPIFAVESYGGGGRNILQLQSTCASNADVNAAVDDASGICGAATPFFLITDNNSPAGVQIYIDEADNDRLKFVSPSATDGYIIMPFECLTTSVSGFAYAVKVTHDAGAAAMKPLYFNDNAAADAQLVWTDTGTSDGVIYAADIEVLAPVYMSLAEVATGDSHTHGAGSLVDAASAAGSSHTHTTSGDVGEVDNGANLATALATVRFVAIGFN